MRRLATILLALGALTHQSLAQSDSAARGAPPAFRFAREAGSALAALWESSFASKEERVACLAATVRNDTVFVSRILALEPVEADSMGIGSESSVEQCGPPEWAGTVHTHVAMYTDSLPSTRFSAQDRGVMSRWYERWHSDGVFCVVYSARGAHCEADGVVGGMRSRPILR
ncbi:MAG: hypothetical protein ACREL3_01945 [Gemmatimonadales bacterium]